MNNILTILRNSYYTSDNNFKKFRIHNLSFSSKLETMIPEYCHPLFIQLIIEHICKLSISEYNEYKKVAVLAIEHTLLQIGVAALEKVQSRLRKDYNCGLEDCYAHPEYLTKVLKNLFGPSHSEIVKSVSRYLDEFSYHRSIAEFLQKII